MGSYQSTHVFVEPLAYGFEEEMRTEKFFVIKGDCSREQFTLVRPPVDPKIIQQDACWTCIQRTRRLIKKDETVNKQRRIVELSKLRSFEREEASKDELREAIAHLELVAEKTRASTDGVDKAPMQLRRQLKDAHQRRRAAQLMLEHAVGRCARKMRASKNLEKLCAESKQRVLTAMNAQIRCALKRSR